MVTGVFAKSNRPALTDASALLHRRHPFLAQPGFAGSMSSRSNRGSIRGSIGRSSVGQTNPAAALDAERKLTMLLTPEGVKKEDSRPLYSRLHDRVLFDMPIEHALIVASRHPRAMQELRKTMTSL